MSERFTRLFVSERNLYAEGCPVVVEGSALLKDNEKGSLIAQLKFKNITNNTIKSIAIKLKLFDNAGRELDKSTEYTYLDISLSRDNTYGDKVPVPVLSLQARSFKICIDEVVFKDNSIYQSDSFNLQSIKEPQLLSSYFNNTDLEEQYSLECDTDARYVPTKKRDLWICTCGEVNRENETSCRICGCSFEKSLEKLDKAKLEENFEARMKENVYTLSLKQIESNSLSELKEAHKNFTELGEYKASKEKAEECKIKIEKLEAELAKKRKRNKKIAIIATPIFCAIIAFVIVFNTVIIPSHKRNKLIENFGEDFIVTVERAQYGDILELGKYEQDNNISNGKEDIEWLVLEKQDDKVLVISKYGLDAKPYNTEWEYVTWETCTLRSWLNNEFINNAFSENEKVLLASNHTQDKAFLLSSVEANKYLISNSEKQGKATEYANANGASTYGDKGTCWWLRTLNGSRADFVRGVDVFSCNVNDGKIAVRPALWIDLNL